MTVRVGIVGLSTSRGWAGTAHLPALRQLPGFAVTALSASTRESARLAAQTHGVPVACGSAEELAARDDVDLVVVTVRVPAHAELVAAAIGAGKMVLCEWPLGVDTAEAEAMAAAAKAAGVRCWTGLQARSLPEIGYVRDLVADGAIGEVLSTTMIGTGTRWGATIDANVEYLLDVENGGTLLTIPFGHAFDALSWALGEPDLLSAIVETRRTTVRHAVTGEQLPMTAPDQVAVIGRLTGGAVASVHYRGGRSAGLDFHWEINGTDGDLVLTSDVGHLQFGGVTLQRSGPDGELERLTVPARYELAPAGRDAVAYPVAQAYAGILQELEGGPAVVPTFADAVCRHRTLDDIREAAATGRAQRVTA